MLAIRLESGPRLREREHEVKDRRRRKLEQQQEAQQLVLESLVQVITCLAKSSIQSKSKTKLSKEDVFTQKLTKWSETLTTHERGAHRNGTTSYYFSKSPALEYLMAFAHNYATEEPINDLALANHQQCVFCHVCKKHFNSEAQHYTQFLEPYLTYVFGPGAGNEYINPQFVYNKIASKLTATWKPTMVPNRERLEKEKALWASEDWKLLLPPVTSAVEVMIDQIMDFDLTPYLEYISKSGKVQLELKLEKFKPGKCCFVDPLGIKLVKSRETTKQNLDGESIPVNLKSLKIPELLEHIGMTTKENLIEPPYYKIESISTPKGYKSGAKCSSCGNSLSIILRNRHHCHNCGDGICSRCRLQCPLLHAGLNTPQGVCPTCFRFIMLNHAKTWALASIKMIENGIPTVAEIYFDVSLSFLRYEKSKSASYFQPMNPVKWDEFQPYVELVALAMNKNYCNLSMKIVKLSASVIEDSEHNNCVWGDAAIRFAEKHEMDFLLFCLAEVDKSKADDTFWTTLANRLRETKFHSVAFHCFQWGHLDTENWMSQALYFDGEFAENARHSAEGDKSEMTYVEKSINAYCTYCVYSALTTSDDENCKTRKSKCFHVINYFLEKRRFKLALLAAFLTLEHNIMARSELIKLLEIYMPAHDENNVLSDIFKILVYFFLRLFPTLPEVKSLRKNWTCENVYLECIFYSLLSRQLNAPSILYQLLACFMTRRNIEGLIAAQYLLVHFFPAFKKCVTEFESEDHLIAAMVVRKIMVLQGQDNELNKGMDLWFDLGNRVQSINPERAYLCYENSELTMDEKIECFLAQGQHETLIDFLFRHKRLDTILEIGASLVRHEETRRTSHIYFSALIKLLESHKPENWKYCVESLIVLLSELFFDDQKKLKEPLSAILLSYPLALDSPIAQEIHTIIVKSLMVSKFGVTATLNRLRCLQGVFHFGLDDACALKEKIAQEVASSVYSELQKVLLIQNIKFLPPLLEYIVWQHGLDGVIEEFMEKEFKEEMKVRGFHGIFYSLLTAARTISKRKYMCGLSYLSLALSLASKESDVVLNQENRDAVFKCVSTLVCQPFHYEGLTKVASLQWMKLKTVEEKEDFLRKYSWVLPCCNEEQILLSGKILAPGNKGEIKLVNTEGGFVYPKYVREPCNNMVKKYIAFVELPVDVAGEDVLFEDGTNDNRMEFMDAEDGRASRLRHNLEVTVCSSVPHNTPEKAEAESESVEDLGCIQNGGMQLDILP